MSQIDNHQVQALIASLSSLPETVNQLKTCVAVLTQKIDTVVTTLFPVGADSVATRLALLEKQAKDQEGAVKEARSLKKHLLAAFVVGLLGLAGGVVALIK